MTLADTARDRILAAHRETVAAVLAGADEATNALSQPASRDEVAAALDATLDDELRASLVDLLRGAVDATGRQLPAEPVPAPPYVVVTARGPLVRATLDDCRLVVLLRAFELDRAAGGYVRAGRHPADAVEVRVRRSP